MIKHVYNDDDYNKKKDNFKNEIACIICNIIIQQLKSNYKSIDNYQK